MWHTPRKGALFCSLLQILASQKEERSLPFSAQFSRFQNKPGPAHSTLASMQGISFQEWKSHIQPPHHSRLLVLSCFYILSVSTTLRKLVFPQITYRILWGTLKVSYDLCSCPDLPCFLLSRNTEKARTYLKRYSTLTVIFKMLKNEIYLCICLFIYQSGWKRWGENCYYSELVSIYENNPFPTHVMII